jgi:hypothetical protein
VTLRIASVLVAALVALTITRIPAQDVTGAAGLDGVEPRVSFSTPTRLKDGDAFIRIEKPGYASPCWADVTGDGKKDLLVGQFAGGKIKIYPGDGKGGIGTGRWLEIDGKVAEVPGVW